MHRHAERFQEKLAALGEPGRVRETETSAHTAADAAAALGVPVAAIVKSLVFLLGTPDGADPLLVLVSGPNRVDLELVGRAAGGELSKADAATVKAATGYSIGGVPPLGHRAPLRTLIDRDLLGLEVLWAAAGTPSAVFPIAPDRLVALSGGEVVRVS
jgi:prolyl-tRNA editing enzyme YbaK/EbsC (Cys-tRNA(Pro) deacylase)